MTNAQALSDARVRAFLDTIAKAEGTDPKGTGAGYNVLVGGSRISDLSRHPGRVVRLSATLSSSAAGRYQFLSRTWADLQRKLQLPDFNQQSQDLAAVQLLRECGALPLILQDNFNGAVQAARKTWASFPGAGYGQGERSIAYLRSAYNSALGVANTVVHQTVEVARKNPGKAGSDRLLLIAAALLIALTALKAK